LFVVSKPTFRTNSSDDLQLSCIRTRLTGRLHSYPVIQCCATDTGERSSLQTERFTINALNYKMSFSPQAQNTFSTNNPPYCWSYYSVERNSLIICIAVRSSYFYTDAISCWPTNMSLSSVTEVLSTVSAFDLRSVSTTRVDGPS